MTSADLEAGLVSPGFGWNFVLGFDFNLTSAGNPISLDWLGPTQQDGPVQYRRNAGTGV